MKGAVSMLVRPAATTRARGRTAAPSRGPDSGGNLTCASCNAGYTQKDGEANPRGVGRAGPRRLPRVPLDAVPARVGDGLPGRDGPPGRLAATLPDHRPACIRRSTIRTRCGRASRFSHPSQLNQRSAGVVRAPSRHPLLRVPGVRRVGFIPRHQPYPNPVDGLGRRESRESGNGAGPPL
jgi:hypothetical protein